VFIQRSLRRVSVPADRGLRSAGTSERSPGAYGGVTLFDMIANITASPTIWRDEIAALLGDDKR
jgi:hypothetical protein